MSDRGQSHVVGVALLLGVAVVSLGALTATIGAVVQDNAARADATRVAADLEAALDPVETTGRHRGSVSFAEGTLRPVDRDLRVLEDGETVRRVRAGGLVFEGDDRRVVAVAGAIFVGAGPGAELRRPPPITASREVGDDGVLVVGAARIKEPRPAAVSGRGGVTVDVRSVVFHERERLDEGTYAVAVETDAPAALRPAFERQGASVAVRDLDGDGVASVVARYPGRRVAYLVVHEMAVEVSAA